jgi:hypothetical protein
MKSLLKNSSFPKAKKSIWKHVLSITSVMLVQFLAPDVARVATSAVKASPVEKESRASADAFVAALAKRDAAAIDCANLNRSHLLFNLG